MLQGGHCCKQIMATQDPTPPPEGAAGGTETSATHHRQLDTAELQSLMPWLNMAEFVAQMEKDEAAICRQRKRGYNPLVRSELRRLKSFEGIDPFISWSPEEMAGVGFYHTGLKTSVQCFCCGGVFCNMGITQTPRAEHQRFEPDCGFLKMLDVGNIPKYAVRVQLPGKVPLGRRQQLTEEGCRLESFKGWPFYAQTEPGLLAGAGFFYTGIKDQVQCFSCDGSLANWEEGDDPWQEHAKWFPQCEYLQGQKSKEERDQYCWSYVGFHGVTSADFLSPPTLEDLCPSPSSQEPDPGWDQNIFAAEKTRLESFHTWPPGCSISPAELAGAGFFYQGLGDCVQCFCCGVQLSGWEEEDNAWTEHRRHSSECVYLLARDKAAGRDVGGEQPLESSLSMPDEEAKEKDDPIAGEYLLSQLDKLKQLKELRIDVGAGSSLKIIDKICDGFAKLRNIEKLALSGVNCVQDSSKLAHLLRNFPQLRVFRLKSSSCFPEFEDLSKALTSCLHLEELALCDFHLSPTETSAFAASLSELRNLRALEVPSISFSNTEDSEAFAHALGSLVLLEKFHLCSNVGTITAALPLTQRLQNLEQLRELIVNKIMDDQSLLELAKATRSGHLRKLNVLDLSLNEELTDLGWRDFFLTLDNVSELRELNISRLYTNQLKPQPDTFKAFVQCVSRLPALVTIRMLSWMLDTMDFNMFNSMKESHPQSRRLHLWWQWTLPFSPIIQANE